LLTVADVARLLPRHWDGQRLLRFLTGLGLLALAFAAHAGLITSPTDAPAAPAAAAVAAPAIAVEPAPMTATVAAAPVPAVAVVPVDRPAAAEVLRIGVQSAGFAVPGGVVPGAHGSRGPPLA
jgi:hypothetical protein